MRCPYFIITYRPMMETVRINSIDSLSHLKFSTYGLSLK